MQTGEFRALIEPLTAAIAGQPVDAALADDLNRRFGPESETFGAVEAACLGAIEAGWMCGEGGPGRRFGRVISPSPETGGLSIDVVDLTDVRGPHHRHPKGEILMIMPQDSGAEFDANGRGWLVYAPGTAHRPTVRGGRALVLYLLPDGEIEFTE